MVFKRDNKKVEIEFKTNKNVEMEVKTDKNVLGTQKGQII